MTVLEARLSTAKAQIKTLNAQVKRMDAHIKKLQRMQFGPSSEKSPSGKDLATDPQDTKAQVDGNGATSEDAAVTDGSQAADSKPRGKLGRQKVSIPRNLHREVRTFEPLKEQYCACGCGTVRLSEQLIERIAYKPAQIYVIEERYPKDTCRKCGAFFQAKFPKRVIDYSKFDSSFIIGAIVAKYADFLPYYRLQEIFGRSGASINRATLSRITQKAGDALRPIYEALIDDLRSGPKLFMDETTIPMLVPGRGKTKTCYAWAMVRDDRRWKGNRPPAVAFNFTTSRAGLHAERFLTDFQGILQVDGYQGYSRLTTVGRLGGPIALAYCWAHVRRKFHDAWKGTGDIRAEEIVHRIAKLFEIERELRGQPPFVRQLERARRSKPIIDALFLLFEKMEGGILMKSALGDAISYSRKLKEGLYVFLADGSVEIDNNPVENTIRPLALLRKNALFAGSEVGGETWAMMSSLIGTCKLNAIEPHAYFTWLFEKIAARLPRAEYHRLLPWHSPVGAFGNLMRENEIDF